ncbi:MAG: hypothetical protein MZU97_16745 [Bacillus subtilis]|nr:hypothetical protein [Bacillus subtilis]
MSTIANLAITLSTFGKIVLALLIQIGGLGIVTIAIYVLVIFGIKIGVTERYVVREALNQNNLGGIVRLLKAIIMTTLAIESVGFVLNFIVFIQDYPFWSAVGHSAFHTISSFNNAGFDVLGETSIQAYSGNILFNISTMLMLILGGLGFIVLQDVWKKRSWKHLSLFSHIVIKTSAFLILFGWISIKLLDYDSVTWLEALFQSVTTRTAGFSTINIGILHRSTLTIMMLLMFIGASPELNGRRNQNHDLLHHREIDLVLLHRKDAGCKKPPHRRGVACQGLHDYDSRRDERLRRLCDSLPASKPTIPPSI